MAYTRTNYGTGYYIYDQFVPGTPLSHPIQSWNESVVPDQEYSISISRSGTDIAPKTGTKEASGKLKVPATGSVTAVVLKDKATIRALSFSISRDQAPAFEKSSSESHMGWRDQPSIDVPLLFSMERHPL